MPQELFSLLAIELQVPPNRGGYWLDQAALFRKNRHRKHTELCAYAAMQVRNQVSSVKYVAPKVTRLIWFGIGWG